MISFEYLGEFKRNDLRIVQPIIRAKHCDMLRLSEIDGNGLYSPLLVLAVLLRNVSLT